MAARRADVGLFAVVGQHCRGAPLPLVLGGQDADGDGLTYTVTSSNPVLTASILKQERPTGTAACGSP